MFFGIFIGGENFYSGKTIEKKNRIFVNHIKRVFLFNVWVGLVKQSKKGNGNLGFSIK